MNLKRYMTMENWKAGEIAVSKMSKTAQNGYHDSLGKIYETMIDGCPMYFIYPGGENADPKDFDEMEADLEWMEKELENEKKTEKFRLKEEIRGYIENSRDFTCIDYRVTGKNQYVVSMYKNDIEIDGTFHHVVLIKKEDLSPVDQNRVINEEDLLFLVDGE